MYRSTASTAYWAQHHACTMFCPHRASLGLTILVLWYRKPTSSAINLDSILGSGVKKWCQTVCGGMGIRALFTYFTTENQHIAFSPSGVKKWCQIFPVPESAGNAVAVSIQIISTIRCICLCAVLPLKANIRLHLHLLYYSFPVEYLLK